MVDGRLGFSGQHVMMSFLVRRSVLPDAPGDEPPRTMDQFWSLRETRRRPRRIASGQEGRFPCCSGRLRRPRCRENRAEPYPPSPSCGIGEREVVSSGSKLIRARERVGAISCRGFMLSCRGTRDNTGCSSRTAPCDRDRRPSCRLPRFFMLPSACRIVPSVLTAAAEPGDERPPERVAQRLVNKTPVTQHACASVERACVVPSSVSASE